MTAGIGRLSSFTLLLLLILVGTAFGVSHAEARSLFGAWGDQSGGRTLSLNCDLSITKTDGHGSYVAGTYTTYTITVSNAGPGAVTGAVVLDTFPAQVDYASWTAVFTGAASSGATSGAGNISQPINLSVGGTAVYTVRVHTPSSAQGDMQNTATVMPPAGRTDPNPVNNTATDFDIFSFVCDLAVTMEGGPVAWYLPGSSYTYTITVSNAGPSDATDERVTDTFPAAIGSVSWTAVFTGGGSGATHGSGTLNELIALPVHATITYTVDVTIVPTATGNLVNTVQVVGIDVNASNNSATVVSLMGPASDLAITKTDGSTTYGPGASTTYTITVTNNGPLAAPGARVTDQLPASLTDATWTVAFTGAGSSGAASGTGNIDSRIDLAVGGTAVYTVTASILPSATGDLVNTATVQPSGRTMDAIQGNNTATDVDARATYTITASAGSHGKISPNGGVNVPHGADQTFAVTPDAHCHLQSLLVDGAPATLTGGGYTFSNVTANHTISATFALDEYTITASAGPHGQISPSGAVSVAHGADQIFPVAPDAHYHLASLLVDGVPATLTGGTYTFTNVIAEHTIKATFAADSYVITASVTGNHGAVSPVGAQSVPWGATPTFVFMVDRGYHVAEVRLDGVPISLTIPNAYTFAPVAADHTLSVTFAADAPVPGGLTTKAPSPATVKKGKTATLKYRVIQAVVSGRADVTIAITSKSGRVVKTLKRSGVTLNALHTAKFVCRLKKDVYSFTVFAVTTDGASSIKNGSNRLIVR